MNYKVLYRKYRPSNFNEVVGQNSTIRILKESIINNKISHAYIFSGPRGTGKTSCAKIFAKTINCLEPSDGIACGKCPICSHYDTSPDIYEIDAASNNGVDQIREIIDNIKLLPIESKYKVYIIDEVHMLSTSAFNALLLTLEEPPSHVVFILATTNIEAVPITVLSRCQRLDFHKISDSDISSQIKNVSKSENIKITDEAVNEIASYADGGMRDALSILDQLSKENNNIDQQLVLDTLGLVSEKDINILIDNIENNNLDEIIKFVNTCKLGIIDYKSLIKKLINILKIKSIDKLKNYNGRLDFDSYKKLIFDLSNSVFKLNINVDPFSQLELILLSYIEIKPIKENNNNIISQEETKNISQEIKTEEKIFPSINSDIVDIRINNCFVKATKLEKQKAEKNWEEIKNQKSDIKSLIIDTAIALASDEIIVLTSELKETVDLINDNLNKISALYNSIFNTDIVFIAVDSELWQKHIETYKKNISNNTKYEYIEEPILENNEEDIFENIDIEIV